MKKTIISLVFVAMVIIGAAGIATWTLFTDTEESTDNQLVAGTLDLKTDDVDGVPQTLYATNMAPGDTVGLTADEMAAMIEVTTLSYDGSSLLGSVSDGNANGYIDVQDLSNADLSGQVGLDSLETKAYVIAVQLRSDTNNDYQADGITMTMTFILNE